MEKGPRPCVRWPLKKPRSVTPSSENRQPTGCRFCFSGKISPYLVVATVQGRPTVILVVTLVSVLVSGFVGGRRAAQAGLVAGLVIDYFAPVLDAREPRFYIIEFRRGHYVLRSRGKNFGDLLLRFRNAIRCLRMS